MNIETLIFDNILVYIYVHPCYEIIDDVTSFTVTPRFTQLQIVTWNGIKKYYFNSLWPSDATWPHRSESTLVQVMACCLTAPSHYLNQCWLIISKVHWHSSEAISQEIPQSSITKLSLKITHEFKTNHIFNVCYNHDTMKLDAGKIDAKILTPDFTASALGRLILMSTFDMH